MQPFENLPEYAPGKNREIKVSLDDLYFLFDELYEQIAEHLDEIPDAEYEKISFLFNKYMVVSKLRDEEAFWYDTVKKIDSSELDADDKTRREAFSFYLKAKTEREALLKEISNG